MTEIACLFNKNGENRRVVTHAIPSQSIIGFMNADPWIGQNRNARRKSAIRRLNHFLNSIYQADYVPIDNTKMVSYASPERINVEDRFVRLSKDATLKKYQHEFMRSYLLPLVSSNRQPISVEKAKGNMRLSFIGFSYGGMFLSGVRAALIEEMIDIGFNSEEIKEIFSNVYHINIGVQRTPDDLIKPLFQERNFIVHQDTQGVWESWVDHDFHTIIPLQNPSYVIRPDGEKVTEPHSQYMYSKALAESPFADEIRDCFTRNTLPKTFQDFRTDEENQFLRQKMNEINYRKQMSYGR